ncbi:hypothetical protein SDC9_202821 [bioreactor metagenome]|uniref:Uncharacterized protein n=1 Tax=bioreactor metagenome TaxID=1076179 RepID=A0A645IW96_9ZZZZ
MPPDQLEPIHALALGQQQVITAQHFQHLAARKARDGSDRKHAQGDGRQHGGFKGKVGTVQKRQPTKLVAERVRKRQRKHVGWDADADDRYDRSQRIPDGIVADGRDDAQNQADQRAQKHRLAADPEADREA